MRTPGIPARRVDCPRFLVRPIVVSAAREKKPIKTSLSGECRDSRRASTTEPAGPVVETVSVDVAALAPGVTSLGEKEQEVRVGRPEQVSETGSSKKPPRGLTVTVYVAASPWATVTLAGETAMAKSVVTTRVAVVERSSDPEVPVMVKVPVGVPGTVVETVRVEVTGIAPGETVLGEKEQEA
jgi:hypothetical protein